MKNQKFYLHWIILFLLTIATFNASAQCDIISFTGDYVPNSCEGEIIEIEFDFDAVDFGASGFTVSSFDGIQQYNIGDDYTYWLIALCEQDITVTITDIDDPNCFAEVILGPACCDCEISDPVLGASSCNNGLFDLQVEFDLFEGTCVNYDWYVTIEGVDYDLDYNNNSGIYEAMNVQAVGDVLTVLLCNESPLNECYTILLDNPCFFTTDCMINAITAYTDVNTCDGEIIDIVFDIDAVDFGLNGFTVSDGIATETFDLNDDFTFTTVSVCDEDLELTFTDLDDPDCYEIITITPDCCDCIVNDILANPTACTNGTFDVQVDMFIESGSCISYDWSIEIEGVDYDLVWNGSTLEATDITATDSLITAIICTLAPSGECFTVEFENPCFVSASNCTINSFTANYDTTSCVGEIIAIEFDFDATDFGTNGFTVSADGDTETYNLGDPYMIYITTLCNEDIEVILTDIDDPNCTATVILGSACCDCEISDPMIETSDCENDLFNIFIDFFYNEGTCVNYDWFLTIDGEDYDLEWNNTTQQYEALDINNTIDSLVTVLLCNDSPLQECFTYSIENPCFESTSNSDCSITSFTADYNFGSCDGEIVIIGFEFDATNFGANGFTISGPEGNQFYNLNDDYDYGLTSYCTNDVELVITDANDPNCTASVILNPACCECEIEDPEIETSDCQNDVFDIFVDYFDIQGTCVNYDWYLTIDGEEYDLEWNSNTQQYEATGISSNAMDSLITILLCNDSPLQECFTYTIENPCFDSNSNADCTINSFMAEYITGSCNGEIIEIAFDIDATDFGANGFEISGPEGSQFYNQGDPYTYGMISLCMDDVELILTDADDPDCTASVVLNPACCDCEIADPIMSTSDCENETFDLFIDFFDYQGSCVNYDWFLTIDGEDYNLNWNSNTQQYEAFNINSNTTDSLITVLLCNDSPLMECFTSIIENPCFDSIGNTSSTNSVILSQIDVLNDISRNIIISNKSNYSIQFQLWSLGGKYIYSDIIAPDNLKTIDHIKLPSGIYLLRLKDDNGDIAVKKVVLI